MLLPANSLTAQTIARHLLKLEAVKLSPEAPFQWASGWKSPIYCDNRLTLSDPDTRTLIAEALTTLIRTHFPEVGGIAGVATAGIPQAALVAEKLDLPMIYIRGKAKGHGRQNQIEGNPKAGMNWVVIEDLVSTGGSSLAAIQALQDTGAEVLGLAAIFTYGFPVAEKQFAEANIKWSALSHYEALLEEALSEGYIGSDTMSTLQAWREAPEKWEG